ncbi:MAG: type 2 lanthipeptide synthetase LanM [Acidobacteriota bacterium]
MTGPLPSGAPPEFEAFRVVPPFADVWIPFVREARGAAWERAEAALLAPAARRTLEGALLADLSFLGAPAIRETGAGLEALLAEFPVLARIASSLARDWAAAAAELAGRLEADRAALAAAYGASGPVTALAAGLSDRHNGGRRVVILTFESGPRVVYKPRHVGLEAEWNGFLDWLHGAGAPDPPPALHFVVRDGYGWAEFAEAVPLPTEEAADAYFRAGGGLLAVAWLLGARDAHMDNVVATPRGPVVVDAEAVLQPDRRPGARGRGAFDAANARLDTSVLATGLLTLEQADAEGRRRDVSGLNGEGRGGVNLPELGGRYLRAEDRPPAVLKGFLAMARFLRSRRGELESGQGPLSGFGRHRVRVVFRPSETYARLLEAASAPPCLREDRVRSARLDALGPPSVAHDGVLDPWPLAADERASLERMDIPAFDVGAAESDLVSRAGVRVAGYFARSGVEALRARLGRMGEEELAAEVRLLTASLTRGASSRAPAADDTAEPVADSGPAVTRNACEAEAVRLADAILADAVEGEDGALVWIDPAAVRGSDRADRGAAYYLYDGGAGMLLCFAAVAAATGLERFREAARRCAMPFARVLDAPGLDALAAAEGLGACNGIGSLVYAYTAAAGLLREEWPLTLARRAAALVTPERIARDSSYDVEGGAAGAILGLLALHAATGDPDALHAAVRCAEHLVSRRRDLGGGAWGWPSLDGLCLAGLAHGGSGIALAVSRLGVAAGREDFSAAARAALRSEAAIFDSGMGNWPVLVREGDGIRRLDMRAWCHGAPGIALARVAMRDLGGTELMRDLEIAVETTRRVGLLSLDHVCCGNAGLVESLHTAGLVLHRPDLVSAANARLGAMLERARKRGGYRLRGTEEESAGVLPGFFRGLAGIAYTLLRVARPDLLPNVLAFEASGSVGSYDGDRTRAVARTPLEVSFERLSAPADPRFLEMTFPAYRRLLALERERLHPDMPGQPIVLPVAVGAWGNGEPIGLALAEIAEGQTANAEGLSLFVRSAYRGRGLGIALLGAIEDCLARMGVETMGGTYMTGTPDQAALERVLEKSGWSKPEFRQLTMRFTLEGGRRMEWYGRYPFGEGYEVFPWKDLTSGEREALRESQRATGWITPGLEPWRHDALGFEPVSSLGIRLHGAIVGWVITHEVDERTVRFTCVFIRRDLGRRGKIVPALSEAIRRLSEGTRYIQCSMTTPVNYRGMFAFVLRRCAAHATFLGETRGTSKRLDSRAD